MKKYTILLVDDDTQVLTGVGKDLESEGYHVTTAESGEEAVELIAKTDFDLVITDLVMHRIGGIEVLKKAKEVNPETIVIILTGFGNMSSSIDALRLDADDYLLKPCESEEMHFRISRSLEKLELKRKIKIYENILPVCCVCKKIRDDSGKEHGAGEWMAIEDYFHKKANIEISSSYCPVCEKEVREKLHALPKASRDREK